MTTEAQWLGTSPGGGERVGAGESVPRADQPRYTISEASEHINELERQNAKWLQDYELLAEQIDGLRECKERLRIRVLELEGVVDMQFGELRQAHGEIDQLRSERDTLRAKADHPRTGW